MINIRLWYRKFQHNIDTKYLILLVLAGLHNDKKISNEKLKGQFQSLKKGLLQKFKNTHHCTIIDRWYNDEPAYEVYLDCISYKNITTIPFDRLIHYIQLFEQKGYNHALNVFGSEYIYKMFNHWNPEYHTVDFTNYIDFHIPNITFSNKSYSCHECGHTHYNYDKNINNNLKIIDEWIHNQKKGNLKKIPYHNVSIHQGFWT